MEKITKKDLEILNSIIKEYAEKQFTLLGLKDVFPEVIQDIQQKQNTLLKIEMIIKMQSNTQKERKWLYVDYEEIYLKLIQIFAEQEDIKVEVNFERRWKQMKRKLDTNKIYNFVRRAVVYSSLYIATVSFTVWGFLQGMTY